MVEANRPIGVIGAGAVGTIVAAHLERSGRRTIVVEQGKRYEEVVQGGLRVSGQVDLVERPWRLVRSLASLSDRERCEPDVWCLCTKAWSIGSLVPTLRDGLPARAKVVGLQNGIGTEQPLAEALGRKRVACTAVNFAGGRSEREGEIRLSWFNPPNYVGVCEGEDETAASLAGAFTHAGLDTELAAPGEIRQRLFYKAVLSAGLNALCAVTDITMQQAMAMPHTRAMARRLVHEALEVGRAIGYPFSDDALHRAMQYLQRGGDHRPSMAVDLAHGHPTEIEFINGKLVELAERFPHVSVEANRFVTSLVVTREIQNGSRPADRIPPYLCS